MTFASKEYLFFFLAVFAAYWLLSRRHQNHLLLVASYGFYAAWDWRFLSLIIISTLVDHYVGHRICDAKKSKARKLWLTTSLVINLSILFYFKYCNFFIDSLQATLTSMGIETGLQTLNIILPVGISFYTFQSLSYSLDIYRGKLKPHQSLLTFATFVAFFPQLVAGPIVRAKEFLYQLDAPRRFQWHIFEDGALRFLKGLFCKVFIADNLGVYLVDPVFADTAGYSSGMLWLAMLGYGVQIYADFSGYSNMAIGSAKMLGFSLPENFNFPYLATSIVDFWRRWHLTMSRFFRDYVYISLGGNQCGPWRNFFNVTVTTLISGLWHGANWTFVIWGGLHGLLVSLTHLGQHLLGQGLLAQLLQRAWWLRWALTQLAVMLLWVVFRSDSLTSAGDFYLGLFSVQAGTTLVLPMIVWLAFAAFVIEHGMGWQKEHPGQTGALQVRAVSWLRASVYVAMMIALTHGMPSGQTPFIYFQF
ncbi:MBOAT family O-acyltransferase [Corallincola spongiicola]|uniref:Probable alginate O-acetylase n=1 Tax=Corallincola spongiicola TaxID=2520508 RepID=A0ABY1WQB8_9GAMM|nr:MBOAT family protein [Corallincola spongiicola]TAA46788.1 MBOAT family protein [Corallincola spongiicola]